MSKSESTFQPLVWEEAADTDILSAILDAQTLATKAATAACSGAVAATLLDLYRIARLPTLVDGGLGRAVEPKEHKIPFAWHCREPIGRLARGRFGAKVQIGTPVGILRRLVARTERGERLAVGEPREALRIVERQGPEDFSRDV